MRHPLVMGNWKLNGSRHMVHELVSNLRKELAGVAGCAVAIAPPEMYIDMAKREAEGRPHHAGCAKRGPEPVRRIHR
ncbi:triosephosphate isomerase [Escherichia coli]|nr:triosephosphate isomerase [Escherichia coli]